MERTNTAERVSERDVGDYQFADWNGDGTLDILSTNGAFGEGLVYEDGADASVDRIISGDIGDFRVVDFDGDGQLDIVSDAWGGLGWFDGNDTTVFNRITFDDVGAYEVADLDGNGAMDVISSGGSEQSGTPLPGTVWYDAAGNRTTLTTDSLGTFTTADIDNDGDVDMVSAGGADATGAPLPGIVTYDVSGSRSQFSYVGSEDFQIAQMDHDEELEVVISGGSYASGAPVDGVLVLDSAFQTSRFTFNDVGEWVIADVDCDGVNEIVGTGGSYQNGLPIDGVAAHESDGTFSRFGDNAFNNVERLDAADWDGDGRTDVLASGGPYGNGLIQYVDRAPGSDLVAGLGNDTLISGTGDDTMTGLAGQDTFVFDGAFGHDVITDFEVGTDIVRLEDVPGVPDPNSFSPVFESVDGDAIVRFDCSSITFVGMAGQISASDFLVVSTPGESPDPESPDIPPASQTLVEGTVGNDWINPVAGGGRIVGYAGQDGMNGATGEADTFVFLTADDSRPMHEDWLYDFELGLDEIDLTSVLPSQVELIGDEAFSGRGTAQIRHWEYNNNGNGILAIDLDGDAVADMQIVTVGVRGLADNSSAFTTGATQFLDRSDRRMLEADGEAARVLSYGTGQDAGTSTVSPTGTGIALQGNVWKAAELDRTITPETWLSFDLEASDTGELLGIGFDDDTALSTSGIFQLGGSQTIGNQSFRSYTAGDGTVHYAIPVGQFYTGSFNNVFFVGDDDADASTNATFSNIRLTEGQPLMIGGTPVAAQGDYAGQGEGSVVIEVESREMRLGDNGWQRFEADIDVDADTVIAFDIRGTDPGEFLGVGVDNDLALSLDQFVRLGGSQLPIPVAGTEFYAPSATFQKFEVPIGAYVAAGTYQNLIFAVDDDADASGAVRLRDIEILQSPSSVTVTSYGGGQDAGIAQEFAEGGTIKLSQNAWKDIDLGAIEIDANTVLHFEFRSDMEGEIQAIGFDTDDVASPNETYQLAGTQTFGRQDVNGQYTIDEGFESYSIAVGQDFTGTFDRLTLILDDDTPDPQADAYFRDIVITGVGVADEVIMVL